MKKILYSIIILGFCILFSGCDINYNIVINEDLTINETIEFNHGIEPYNEEYGEDFSQEDIDESLDYALQTAKENNYEVIDNSTDKNITLTFKRTINFEAFKDPVALSGVYENFKTTCNDSFCSITAKSIKNDVAGDGNVANYKTSITVPYNVIKSNADEIDLKSNTYIWYYVIEGDQNNIEIIFDRIGKNVIKENEQKEETNSLIWFIIIFVIVAFLGIVLYKIIKNNKPKL